MRLKASPSPVRTALYPPDHPTIVELDSSVSKSSRHVEFHLSTFLLLMALLGLLLRLSGAGALLHQHSATAAMLLVTLAPLWALFGSSVATVFLILTVWRPRGAAQHLVEMVLGILLTVLMRPVF